MLGFGLLLQRVVKGATIRLRCRIRGPGRGRGQKAKVLHRCRNGRLLSGLSRVRAVRVLFPIPIRSTCVATARGFGLLIPVYLVGCEAGLMLDGF